ncbi:MAG TPA: hypothetical protein VGN88_02720 [Phycisphaerae bacterium]|jgi:hypothetical protein
METLSHKFIAALLSPRDHLYSLALASAGNAAAAENILAQSARETFKQFAADSIFDIPAAFEKSLTKIPGKSGPSPEVAQTAMPADVWARLAAAVQLEAASSAHATALNPDSVLLKPDPLLAPKKSRHRSTLPEEFNVTTPKRLATLLLFTLAVGIVITIYILTRQSPKTHPNSPNPASNQTPAASRGAP